MRSTTGASHKNKHAAISASAAGRLSNDVRPKDLTQSIMYTSMPWLSDGRSPNYWSPMRIIAAKVVCSTIFDMLMGAVIIFNAVLIVLEADYAANCYPQYANNISECPQRLEQIDWHNAANSIVLVLYTAEILLRLYVFRRNTFVDNWYRLDSFVVVLCWAAVVYNSMTNLSFVRLVRLARLTRSVRILRQVRELNLLIGSLVSSFKAMFFGCLLILVMLVIYGILMVEWVHPVNSQVDWGSCTNCHSAFSSVESSIITLFGEMIGGGSWIMSLELFESDPTSTILMVLIFVTINLTIMNLILAVICERAAEARENDVQEVARQKLVSLNTAKKELMNMCAQMDKDESGKINVKELQGAFDNSQRFNELMIAMDLNEEELLEVFQIADRDGTGELEYECFCNELFHLKNQDQHVLLTMIRLCAQKSYHVIDSVVHPKLQTLVEQAALHTAQFATLNDKVERLQVLVQAVPCAEAQPENMCVGEVRGPSGETDKLNHQIGPQENQCEGEGSEPSVPLEQLGQPIVDGKHSRHDSNLKSSALASVGTHALTLEVENMSKDLEQRQQELQIMLEADAFFLNKAATQVDTSPPKLTSSFFDLLSDGKTGAQGIQTLDVWLAERKYQRCKSTLSLLSNMEKDTLPMQSHGNDRDLLLKTIDGRDSAIVKEQVLCQLKQLLLQLLPLCDVTKGTASLFA